MQPPYADDAPLAAEQRAPPKSKLTDGERREAARLKLRNALQGGHADVAMGLLDENPAAAKAMDVDGRYPIHIALKERTGAHIKDNIAVICMLGEMHPSACQAGDPERRGALPLHSALELGHDDIVCWEVLNRYPAAAMQASPTDGRLPLMIAIEHRSSVGVVNDLLKAHPEAIHELDASNRLPLHLALEARCAHDIIRLLLKKNAPAALEV